MIDPYGSQKVNWISMSRPLIKNDFSQSTCTFMIPSLLLGKKFAKFDLFQLELFENLQLMCLSGLLFLFGNLRRLNLGTDGFSFTFPGRMDLIIVVRAHLELDEDARCQLKFIKVCIFHLAIPTEIATFFWLVDSMAGFISTSIQKRDLSWGRSVRRQSHLPLVLPCSQTWRLNFLCFFLCFFLWLFCRWAGDAITNAILAS